jgi:hypothetical protein
MAHRNARLTEFGRLLLVQRVTELGWPQTVEPANQVCPNLARVISQAHRGTERVRRTPQLADPFLRHTSPSAP